MIIRAVSDSESDNDDHGTPSVFGNTSALAMHNAKRAWISATLVLVALVLVDLAALMSAFAPAATGAPVRDPFALVPMLLDAYFVSSSALVEVATSATALNNIVGLIGVAAWIASREAAIRQRRSRSSSSTVSKTLRSPYTLVAGVLCFGHVVSCLYVLLALVESHGDRKRFFLGTSSSVSSRLSPSV